MECIVVADIFVSTVLWLRFRFDSESAHLCFSSTEGDVCGVCLSRGCSQQRGFKGSDPKPDFVPQKRDARELHGNWQLSLLSSRKRPFFCCLLSHLICVLQVQTVQTGLAPLTSPRHHVRRVCLESIIPSLCHAIVVGAIPNVDAQAGVPHRPS